MNIQLSQIVEDRVTGFRGMAISRHEYLDGTVNYGVHGRVGEDGKYPEIAFISEKQLKLSTASIPTEGF